jgi:hypothetical protein
LFDWNGFGIDPVNFAFLSCFCRCRVSPGVLSFFPSFLPAGEKSVCFTSVASLEGNAARLPSCILIEYKRTKALRGASSSFQEEEEEEEEAQQKNEKQIYDTLKQRNLRSI